MDAITFEWCLTPDHMTIAEYEKKQLAADIDAFLMSRIRVQTYITLADEVLDGKRKGDLTPDLESLVCRARDRAISLQRIMLSDRIGVTCFRHVKDLRPFFAVFPAEGILQTADRLHAYCTVTGKEPHELFTHEVLADFDVKVASMAPEFQRAHKANAVHVMKGERELEMKYEPLRLEGSSGQVRYRVEGDRVALVPCSTYEQ